MKIIGGTKDLITGGKPIDFKIQLNIGHMLMPPEIFSNFTEQLTQQFNLHFDSEHRFICTERMYDHFPELTMFFKDYSNVDFNLTLPWEAYIQDLGDRSCQLRVSNNGTDTIVVGTHFLK